MKRYKDFSFQMLEKKPKLMTSSHVQYSVQIPDNQLQIFPQEQQQKPMVVNQLKGIVTPPMTTSTNQVVSKSVLQSTTSPLLHVR